jgi:hypothetical protein
VSTDRKFMWLTDGRRMRIRHAHAVMGDFLHLDGHHESLEHQDCWPVHEGQYGIYDTKACQCGFIICAKRGPCAATKG